MKRKQTKEDEEQNSQYQLCNVWKPIQVIVLVWGVCFTRCGWRKSGKQKEICVVDSEEMRLARALGHHVRVAGRISLVCAWTANGLATFCTQSFAATNYTYTYSRHALYFVEIKRTRQGLRKPRLLYEKAEKTGYAIRLSRTRTGKWFAAAPAIVKVVCLIRRLE